MNLKFKIFYGSSVNRWNINFSKGKLDISEFANNETRIELKESVRGCKVILLQGFINDINNQIIETLLIIDALKRAGAIEIILIIPLLPYSRQDRKHMRGVPISAKVICDLFSKNVNQIITFDLHANQIQGFTDSVTIENLSLFPYITAYLHKILKLESINFEDITIVAPDEGSIKRAKTVAYMLKIKNIVTFYKERVNGDIGELKLLGKVKTSKCIMIDDMIDSGRTLIKTAKVLKQYCDNIYVLSPHLILSNDAYLRLNIFDKVIGTNSIPHHENGFPIVTNLKFLNFGKYFEEYLYPILEEKKQFFSLYNIDTFE